MKIVTPSATLLAITPDAEQLIERCGRVCYKSEDKITSDSAAAFIAMILKRGHHSVLEHASATFLIVCDRGVTHELVRHRLASYSQESTRYCNYGRDKFGGVSFIRPPKLNEVGYADWVYACRVAEEKYMKILETATPQIARSVLPNCLKTEIAVTANLREWRHILTLRTSEAAHPQIREVMELVRIRLVGACPNVFADFKESRVGESQ